MKKLIVLLTLFGVFWYIGQREGFLTDVSLRNPFSADSVDPTFSSKSSSKIRVLDEESSTISAIEKALPSVVTVKASKTSRTPDRISLNPFDLRSPFQQIPGEDKTIEGNIGSGFALTSSLVVTNKHVVSDSQATYSVVTADATYEVESISKDPLNDLALLKVKTDKLTPITLSDSTSLKLGQRVIAIGTPLGEFTNSVTTGIVSGLGRGITAGSPFEGFVERLDNVIQTDAAINPGNSGGPLLNSQGDVIGINTAVSQDSQNIGFAIPVNVLKDLLKNYDSTSGTIQRPFLGVRYQMLKKDTALLNDVPEGAYVVEVVPDSPADKAGIRREDIITRFDGTRVQGIDDNTLQKAIASKKINSKVTIVYWREGKTYSKSVTLSPTQ